jgi:hypothetical protein
MITQMSSNLNLNKLKIVFSLFLLASFSTSFGQSKSNIEYGASISLGVGSAITNSASYKQYSDTVLSKSHAHFNKGIHAWVNYSLGKKADLQLGIGYQQIGFSRIQENLTFKNYTYPGIGTGRIEDLSNTDKGIVYNYKFNYLQFPLMINSYLGRSGDFKWVYNFTAGITPQVLIKHRMVANCIPGYSIEGENQFKFDSTGFDARPISANIQVGLKIEYRETKSKVYFIQPLIGIYPMSVTKSTNTAIPYFFSLNLGMLFSSK